MADTEIIKGVRVSHEGGGLVIRWRRFGRLTSGCRAFIGEMILFLIGLTFFGLPARAYLDRILQQDWSAFRWTDLFSLPFLLIGGVLVYRTLTTLFNVDIIEVTPEVLKVYSFPIPALDGTVRIPLQSIRSVECKVRILSSGRSGRRTATPDYEIVAGTLDGKNLNLLTGSTAPEPAGLVAEEIMKYVEAVRAGHVFPTSS